MILNYLDGTIQTTNTYTILNNLDTNIIPSVNSNINIGDKEKTIKELFVNDILLDSGEITKKTRYNVDISTSNITSSNINTEENYIIYNLNSQDLNEQGDGSSSYTLEFTNNTTGKLLIYDTIGKEHDVDLYSPINIVVGSTQSSVTINDSTYYTVGGTSNIQSDITGSNITYSSSIVIIKYYNWGYNTEPYFNRNYYSLWNRPYIPIKEIDYYDQEYINNYSINRLFKSIYYENFYDAKIPIDTVDVFTENLNNDLIINGTDPNNYFQVISLRYSANNSEYLVNTDSIKTGPHFISEDDSVYSTNKYIAFRGKDGSKYRYFITGDISNLIKITDSITISYIVGSGSVDTQDVETYGNGGDKPINGAFRIQILDNTDTIIFNEIIWISDNGYIEDWQLFTININDNTRVNGIKLKIVHIYNPQNNDNWNQTFGVRYIGLNILDEYKNYISLENIPSAYPNSNNILWKDNYGNLKIDNYQFTQDYNTLENNPFENTSNYIYTNLNKNIGIGITTPQEKLHVDGNTIINSNLSVASNIYFSGNLYQNGQLYESYTDNNTSNYLLNNLNTSIIPNEDLVYDLGSVENRFKDLYIGDNSIWLGDEHKLSISEGKIKFRKRLVNNVPSVISSHDNYNENSLKQILGLSTEQNINYEDIKLKHWLRYARTLDGFENISINEIFRDNETDYQEETSSDLWINHNNNIIFGNYSNIGIGTNTPTEKLHIDGNVIVSSNLTVNDTSTLNNVEFSTSYGNWNINMNKIYEKNLTEERMYPPIRNLTSASHTISGQEYGNGLYETWESSKKNNTSGGYSAFNTDYEVETINNYSYTGNYNSTNNIVGDYNGEWIKIKLPVKINLTKYRFERRFYHSPAQYKIYGSNDNEKWDVLVHKTSDISYVSNSYEESITTTGEYQYFALVVNKLVGYAYQVSDIALPLKEWYIYGKEIITISGGELKITNENSKGITIDNSGFVGFNNNAPQNTIDVDGNINIENNEDKTALILNQKVEQPIVDIKKNDQSILFINELGHIGINNNQPTKTLEVGGDAMIISNLFIGSNIYISGDLFKNDELYTSYTDNDTSNYLLNNLNTSIIPNENLVYNLGSADKRFNELFIHNANVDGTLTTSNLNIIGDITKINTTIYESENLSIFNEQADGPSLNIIHNDNLHNIFDTSNLFNNKKFIVDYNCHVGINTVPEAELHVNGNIKFSGSINNVTSQSLDYIQNLDENIITKITQTSNFLDNKSSNFVISIYNELNDKIDNISIIDNTIVFDGSQVITGFVNANLIPIDNSTIYNDNGVLKVNPNNNNTELNTFIGKYEKTEEYIENINSISNTVTTIDNRFFYENTTLTSNITVSNNHPNFFTSQTIYPRNIYNRTINYTSTTNEWTDIEYTIITNSSDGIFDNNYDTYGSHKVFSHNLTEFYKSSQVFDESGNYTGSNNFKGTIGLSISIDLGRSIYLRTLKFLPNSSTYNSGMPNNFKIYASNDSNCWGDNSHSSWIVIYNNVTLLEYNPYEFTLFGNFNNLLTKYRFFTLVVNNINGNNTYLELNELSIIGVDDIINQPISIDNETNTYAIKLEYNEVVSETVGEVTIDGTIVSNYNSTNNLTIYNDSTNVSLTFNTQYFVYDEFDTFNTFAEWQIYAQSLGGTTYFNDFYPEGPFASSNNIGYITFPLPNEYNYIVVEFDKTYTGGRIQILLNNTVVLTTATGVVNNIIYTGNYSANTTFKFQEIESGVLPRNLKITLINKKEYTLNFSDEINAKVNFNDRLLNTQYTLINGNFDTTNKIINTIIKKTSDNSIIYQEETLSLVISYLKTKFKQEYNILPPYLNIDLNYLYAHYTFENNFNDSKNSYNLINNNNCVINYDNRLYDNCALYLDGTANIEFPDNINLYNIWNNDNGLTISFWFNMLETTQSYGTILEFAYQSIKYNNESNYRLSIMKNNNDNNSIQIYWKDLNIDKGVTIQLVNSYNNWNHLSFCIDKYGLWYVYLNGKLQTIDISYFEPPDITYNVKVIGRSSYSTSQNFNGYIDDLRFYSKVLDQKEIKILYESIYQTIYTSIFNDIIFADILLVAGGGSGGGSTGGGGGAGGILYTKKNYIPNNSYIFRIGKGGDSVLSDASHDNQDGGNDGINTIAMDTVVFGGGGGGGSKDGVGNPGGSGGGGAFETAFGGSIMTPIYGTVIINGEYYGNVGVSTKNSIVSGDGGSGIFNYSINGVTEYYGGAGKGRDSLLNITTTFDNSSTLGGGGGGGGWTSNTYSGKGGNGIVIIKYYLDKNETQEYSIETSDDYKVLSGDKVLLNSSLVRRVYNTGDNYFTVYNLEETDIETNIGTITTFVKLNNILKFNIINNINDHIVYYSNSENYTKIVIPRNDVYKININAVFNLEFSSEFCKFYIKLDRLGYQPRYLRTFYLPPISEYSSNDSFTLDVTSDLELLVNDIITFESNYKLSVYKDSFLTITGTNKTIIDGTLIQNIYNTSANEAFVFQSPLNKLGNIVSLDQSQLNFNINFSQPLIYNNNNVSIQTNYYANYSHTHSASDIVSGIFDKSLLPIATDTDIGCIKVDNSSILIDSFGMISATPHYTDTDFDLRYDIRRSEGLQISGPANNINTLVSANIGVYDSIYSYIDLRTSSNNGGWIDFGSTAGEDFKVRIRGHNEPRQIEFYTSDNANMTLNESGDLLVSGNITAYYSDERLKKITSNIENVLNTLQNIDVFKYKTNDLAHSLGIINNNDEIGLSAQQVNKYYPELVSIAPFDRKYDENIKDIISKSGQKYLTLNYERLVPILLQGIKELNDKNIKLENELTEIKNDIKDIKKYIN